MGTGAVSLSPSGFTTLTVARGIGVDAVCVIELPQGLRLHLQQIPDPEWLLALSRQFDRAGQSVVRP